MPRDGTKNLKPQNTRTKEKQREVARKGGIASGKAKREKKTLRQCLELLLEQQITSKDGTKVTGAEAISIAQFKKALKGDTKAFEVVRDTSGNKPIEKIIVSEVSQEIIDEVEKMVKEK